MYFKAIDIIYIILNKDWYNQVLISFFVDKGSIW